MKLLRNKQQESYENAKLCYICKKKKKKNELKINIWKIKKYHKVRDHCHFTGKYRSVAYSICNLKYSVFKSCLKLFIIDLAMITILS